MTSIKGKRHRISDNITYFFIYLCAAISVLLLLGIIVYVFVRGIGQINWNSSHVRHLFLKERLELQEIFSIHCIS